MGGAGVEQPRPPGGQIRAQDRRQRGEVVAADPRLGQAQGLRQPQQARPHLAALAQRHALVQGHAHQGGLRLALLLLGAALAVLGLLLRRQRVPLRLLGVAAGHGLVHGPRLGPRPLPRPQRQAGHEQERAQRRQRGHGRPPPRPLPGAHGQRRRPRPHRLAGPEAVQVVGERGGTGVAPGRLLAQALQADGFQVARQARLQPRRRHRLARQRLQDGLHRRAPQERRPPGQQVEEDGAQGVRVRGGTDLGAVGLDLFGRQVAGAADDDAHLGQVGRRRRARGGVEVFGEAEVGDLGRAVVGQQDVGGLEVAVDDAPLVGVVNRPRHLGHQLRHRALPFGPRHRPAAGVRRLLQAAALGQFQRQVRLPLGFADVEDLDDVGVLQPRDRLRLGAEAGQVLRVVGVARDHLQRHAPPQPLVPGVVHHPHAAAPQQPQHLIPRHHGQGLRRRTVAARLPSGPGLRGDRLVEQFGQEMIQRRVGRIRRAARVRRQGQTGCRVTRLGQTFQSLLAGGAPLHVFLDPAPGAGVQAVFQQVH